MATEVMAIGDWATNAEMIADVARLGYIKGAVLDPTYGEFGGFWKVYRPENLTFHDLKLDGVDFCFLPYAPATFDTVVFDPPYKLAGTPASPEMDRRYGTEKVSNRQALYRLIEAGIDECIRVLRPRGHLLFKCQDMVESGEVRWQTRHFTSHVEARGLRLIDWFLFRSYRPQPEGRQQVHARRNYSSLLVFRKV